MNDYINERIAAHVANGHHIVVEQLATNGEDWKKMDEWIGDDEDRKAFAYTHILMTTPVFGLYGYTIRKCYHQKDDYWRLPKDIVDMVLQQGNYIPSFALPFLIKEEEE